MTRKSTTINRELGIRLREMNSKYQEYARLRELCASLKVEFELAQRKEFELEKSRRIDEEIRSMSPEELKTLAALAKKKGY